MLDVNDNDRRIIDPPKLKTEEERAAAAEQQRLVQVDTQAVNNRGNNPTISNTAMPGMIQPPQLNPIETKQDPVSNSTRNYFSTTADPSKKFYQQINKDGSVSYHQAEGVFDKNGNARASTTLKQVDKDGKELPIVSGSKSQYDRLASTGIFTAFENAMKKSSEAKEEIKTTDTKTDVTKDTKQDATATAEIDKQKLVKTTELAKDTKPTDSKPVEKTETINTTAVDEASVAENKKDVTTEGKNDSATDWLSSVLGSDKKSGDSASGFDQLKQINDVLPVVENSTDKEKVISSDLTKGLLGLSLRPDLTAEQKQSESLALVAGSLSQIRDLKPEESSLAQTAEAKQEQLDSHKALLQNLVNNGRPEDEHHYGAMAASVLLQAKDNEATADKNELKDFTEALVKTGSGEIDLPDLVSKADSALSHLERSELADVYSEVIKTEMDGLGVREAFDPDGKNPEGAAALVDGYSKALGDIASRLDSSQKANLVGVAEKLGSSTDLEQIKGAFAGNEAALTALGLTTEEMDGAKTSLVNGGLNYLKDKIGLTQNEVDQISKLYKLNGSLVGEDGKFNRDDIPALAAALGINDIKTLSGARSLIEATIMSEVSKTAYSMAHSEATRAYNSHPDVQRGRSLLQRPLVRFFAGGYIQGQLNQGWGKAMGIANREASNAINGIRSSLGDDFGPMSRAMTAIETRDQLASGLSEKSNPQYDHASAGKFFENFNKQALGSIPTDPAQREAYMKQADESFMSLNRASLESQIKSSISGSRDITGATRDQLLGINKYLALKSNMDLREGMNQESLQTAQSAIKVAQNVFDRALGVTNPSESVKIQDAAAMIDQLLTGEISMSQVPESLQRFIDPSIKPATGATSPQAAPSKFNNLVDFVKGERSAAKDFSVFEHEGKQYLGFTDGFGPGYVKENPNGTNTRIYISESNKNQSYQAALQGGGASAFTQSTPAEKKSVETASLKINPEIFTKDDRSFSAKVAQDMLGENNSYKALSQAINNGTADQYLKDNVMSGFQLNGENYLGYQVKDPKTGEDRLAYMDSKGNTRYINDEAVKSALYGAMSRDGIDVASVKQFAKLDSQAQNELLAVGASRQGNYSSQNYQNNNYQNSNNSGTQRSVRQSNSQIQQRKVRNTGKPTSYGGNW